jgi:GTPase SAR1 family protein
VIVFDLTDRSSFENLTFWIDPMRQDAPDAYRILVGNRADLAERRAVLAEEAEAFAAAQGMEYIEVSAKTGMGVSEMSLRLVNGIAMASLKLLWRGSRDGFRSRDFHRRCDGHANTLTDKNTTR